MQHSLYKASSQDRTIEEVFARPANFAHHGQKIGARSHKTTSTRTNRKVFIVEDERLVAENLRLVLEDHNWKVLGIASSGEEAVRGAEATKPDLLLMDIRIQGEMDGIQAALFIQQSLPKKLRILFLSAHAQESFPHLNTLAPGSFAYLKKPYTPEDLTAEIEKLLDDVPDS